MRSALQVQRLVRSHAGWLWLALLLSALAVPKLMLSARSVMPMGDGGYYANVAAHVRDGDGLVTDLSLMHQGFERFPHPSPIYPLWPLILGYCAKVVDLELCAIWLPTLCYFAALVFAYLWGRALAPDELAPQLFPGFNAGHLVMLVFGLDREFFWFTSLPYTEGLAYALLFAALYRGQRLLCRPSLGAGLELGLWGGLMTLARSQLILFMLALVAALALAFAFGAGRRRPLASTALGAALAFALAMLPHYLHVASFVSGSALSAMLRFDRALTTPELSPLQVMVETDSAWGYLVDRLRGLPIAFELGGKFSYTRQFWLFPYALPAALFVLCWRAARRIAARGAGELASGLRALAVALGDPTRTAPIFAVVLALGGLLSLQIIHKRVWDEWNFHMRHAIVCGLAFFLCMLYLLRRRAGLAIGVFILFVSVRDGAAQMPGMLAEATKTAREPAFRPEFVSWIRQHAAGDRELVIVTRQTQRLWQLSPPNVHYHMYYDDTTLSDLDVLRRRGADFVAVQRGYGARFLRNLHFVEQWKPLGEYSGFVIYAPIERSR